MVELSPEGVFRLHPKIRWAGLSNDRGEIIFCQMRHGVQSITPEEDDRSLLELGAVIMTGVAERSSPYAGRMQCLVILYEKFGQLIVKQKDGNLVLTVEREDAPQTLLDIIKSFDWTEA